MNNERQYFETSRTTRSSGRSSSTSTTTTTRNTEPGVSCSEQYDWHVIVQAYHAVIQQPMTQQVAMFLGNMMREGMEPEVILNAIQDTGWAPRPSPQYLRAILLRCRRQGILTAAAWDYQQAERETAISQANTARYDAWSSYPGMETETPY